MRTKASIGGHPLHPMLVTFPIALFIVSLVADFVYVAVGQVFWYDLAWWTMAFGIGGALLAAVPGMVDYFGTARRYARPRKLGLMHMAINLSVVALYVVNLLLRADYNAATGTTFGMAVTISAVAVLALGVSGWLGGSMVYKHRVGVSDEAVSITMAEAETEKSRR